MSVRAIGWQDIPSLYRNRYRCVFMDTALVLTRGPLVVQGALLSCLMPETGVATYIYQKKNTRVPLVFGQVIQTNGSPFAHLTFLTPDAALDSPDLVQLLDILVMISGKRGAYHLLAEVDEKTHAFESLRQSNFAIFTRQRIWQLTTLQSKTNVNRRALSGWRRARSRDLIAIHTLYNNIVPGLVQQIEPFSLSQKAKGLVYEQKDGLSAFVQLVYGHRGIWVQPFIHPDAEDIAGQLRILLENLPDRHSRPIYICIRSYQSWLESVLEDLGVDSGPRQAVMVKHLAVVQKVQQSVSVPSLEGKQPEITTPISTRSNIRTKS